jgi:hypothetical protein
LPPGIELPAGIQKQEVVDMIFQATKDLVKKSEFKEIQDLAETMRNNEHLMIVLQHKMDIQEQ